MTDDSFVRWQQAKINQHTYTIDLLLTLAVAALGFQAKLLVDGSYDPVICTAASSMLFLTASVFIGLMVALNRLKDFRLTAQIALKREKGAGDSELESDRQRADRLGDITWCLFNWQVGAFGLGMILAIITVIDLKLCHTV